MENKTRFDIFRMIFKLIDPSFRLCYEIKNVSFEDTQILINNVKELIYELNNEKPYNNNDITLPALIMLYNKIYKTTHGVHLSDREFALLFGDICK